jgi:hypothetical protein
MYKEIKVGNVKKKYHRNIIRNEYLLISKTFRKLQTVEKYTEIVLDFVSPICRYYGNVMLKLNVPRPFLLIEGLGRVTKISQDHFRHYISQQLIQRRQVTKNHHSVGFIYT